MDRLIFKFPIFCIGSKNSFLSYLQFEQAKSALLINARGIRRRPSADGGRIPAHMEPNEMYGQGGEANVPTSSQSTPTNGGIENVTSVGPSSPVRGTSSTEHSRVASCIMRSRSMPQQELNEVY